MKTLLTLFACVALVGVAFAQPPKKGKGKHSEEAVTQAPRANKPARMQGMSGTRRTQKFGQSQSNAGPGSGPHGHPQTLGKRHGRNFQSSDLPAVQRGGKKFRSGSNLPAVQGRHGGKFQARQFKFGNKPKRQIAAVKFVTGSGIKGSHNWHGKKYVAFRNYRAQWHDRSWWRHHHNRIVFVFGGWYYWNAGWWYPAWGYDPGAYYVYDGPIYGYNSLPPDQVVANVQAALQEQGYYAGEVDGLLGPLTRAALARYQQDHGLYATAAIDEPTLAELGMV